MKKVRIIFSQEAEEVQLEKAMRIEIARIHPRYLVFNDRQAHLAGLDSYQDRDVFLDRVVQAAYTRLNSLI